MQDRTGRIERLKYTFYLHERTKAYDFTKSKEIRECLKMCVCAFIDYSRYLREAKLLEDAFEASVEVYDPVTWMGMTGGLSAGDPLVINAMRALNNTSDHFASLKQREERVCRSLLARILRMVPEIRVYVLGGMFAEMIYDIDEFTKNLFENFIIPINELNSEQAYSLFIDYISEL